MPALFRRSRRDDDDDVVAHVAPPSIAALIADHLEAGAEDARALSHREFREFVRDRARSQDEAMSAIREAARHSGHR
ncbi:MAG TPA: hypothetical protein VG321_02125 [Solirubrobacteraceae bacterium]|jgi:hypothetical protein|nr:hypothetical protein [Solirubrobacteraceae bacterium]